MAKGMPQVTIKAVTIPKVVISEKCEIKFGDLKLDAKQCDLLAQFCQDKTQVDLIIKQRQGELI